MKRNQDGYIVKIVLIVVALVAVKYYFHFDIVEWYNSPTGQKYVGTIWEAIKAFYMWVDQLFRSKLG